MKFSVISLLNLAILIGGGVQPDFPITAPDFAKIGKARETLK